MSAAGAVVSAAAAVVSTTTVVSTVAAVVSAAGVASPPPLQATKVAAMKAIAKNFFIAWVFLFCEIFEGLYSGSLDMDPSPSKQIADLQPHEIFNSDKYKNNPDYRYGGHISVLGNQEIAKDLSAWYRENIC